MHFRDAQAVWTPTIVPQIPLSAEHEHIRTKIAGKEREIARLAGEIRWLRMELETG